LKAPAIIKSSLRKTNEFSTSSVKLKMHTISWRYLILINFSAFFVLAFATCSHKIIQPVVSDPYPHSIDVTSGRFGDFISTLISLPENRRDSAVVRLIKEFPQTPLIEDNNHVNLYWYGKAGKVEINGDLQRAWSRPESLNAIPCGENTFFHITYQLPQDARIDYQFIIDSKYTTDPRNPAITPSGYGPHSEIAMPGFKPDPSRHYLIEIPHGTLDSILFTSDDESVLPRQVKVYLPAGYTNHSDMPVLFVLDGIEAMDFMSIPVVLDNLIAAGKIEPLIAVFIPPAKREAEYLGTKETEYINVLCDEWVPLVDRTFKTAALPGKRGITGISAGGHTALLTALSRPDVFLCAAGQSPVISKHLYKALQVLKKKEINPAGFHIWMDAGRYDLLNGGIDNSPIAVSSESLYHDLESSGFKPVFRLFNDGHEWANWRERTDDILKYFFGIENKSDR
jgi:enterochelin esterase-like enzyme